jgi:hypothetical protein
VPDLPVEDWTVTLNRQDVTESFQSLSKTLFVLRGHHEIAIAGAQAKCFRGFGVGDGAIKLMSSALRMIVLSPPRSLANHFRVSTVSRSSPSRIDIPCGELDDETMCSYCLTLVKI